MPAPSNRRRFSVFLSALLGCTALAVGWTTAFRGPSHAPERQAVSQAPHQTRPVQVLPIQPPADTPAPGNPLVVISTSLGDITVELFKEAAPVSTANFLQYVNDGFYTNTIFHRVRQGFMIQGGGFTPDLVEKPTRPAIQNEATNGLRNVRGTIAMARKRALRSATAQFYINVVDNRALDHTGFSPDEFGYAVFGRVVSGMEVADRIAAVPTTTKGDMDDVPVEPVTIKGTKTIPNP
jgi:peptidyl-prolyl cis-trans isomerase A (cyclophilin A)